MGIICEIHVGVVVPLSLTGNHPRYSVLEMSCFDLFVNEYSDVEKNRQKPKHGPIALL